MSRFGIFTINDEQYDLDELTLDEGEEIEERTGSVLSEINYGSIKAMKSITHVLLKRRHSDLSEEELGQMVGKIKLISFTEAEEQMPTLPPDDLAAQESPKATNGSGLEDSGALSSVASTTG